MTKPCQPSPFQDGADVLLFCCLVESGVGDGLGPLHFQYLPQAGVMEAGQSIGVFVCHAPALL